MLSNGNVLLQEGVTHDAVIYDQQFNEVKRQKGTPMHETWLAYEPNITCQRKTNMVVQDKYVTWFNSTESSAILDVETLEAYQMDGLWKMEATTVSAMVVTASPDLSKYAGIGEYTNVQTFHIRARDHTGSPVTTVKRIDALCQDGTMV